MVGRNPRRATELVNDLRLLVSASAGDSEGRPRSLRSIIGDVVHEVSSTAGERAVGVSVLEPIPDASVDGARATLVLVNLTWNAIKYADPARTERWVRIGAGPTPDGGWHCFVADNGVGIAEKDQERVFERFQRAHENLASGTGLGLAVAKGAVAQLGGQLWLESREGLGTTFHFTIPPEA